TVVPINPHEHEVEGLKAYPSVLDVPGAIDMATLYVPPEIGERIIEEIARKQIREVWLNPGAESDALIARAKALAIEPIVAGSFERSWLRRSRPLDGTTRRRSARKRWPADRRNAGRPQAAGAAGRSSNHQILKSSAPQILKSSDPHMLKSSDPQIRGSR